MYKCNHCEEYFDKPKITIWRYGETEFCPECGSSNITEQNNYDILDEKKIDCNGCGFFIGARCSAAKCPYKKFDK